MPYKRKKLAHRHRDVIPKTMTRTLVYERDICIPANVPLKDQAMSSHVADSEKMPFTVGNLTTYCPTYLAISANAPTDIFPNIPINASDGSDTLNFGHQQEARDASGVVVGGTAGTYNKHRTIGMMQTLHWRRQVPRGWDVAAQHYAKYRVMSSTVQIDLVPQPLMGEKSSQFTQDTVVQPQDTATDEAPLYDWSQYMGQGSDAVTSVVSLHQQHFRMPKELYDDIPSTYNYHDCARRINLKRIITAGTIHTTNNRKDAAVDRDSREYDPKSSYMYYPPKDTTPNFHLKWPKTKQVVIPAYVDKISPWSHPKKKHLFRASWKCPAKKDAEEREEYEAYLNHYNHDFNNDGTADIGESTVGGYTTSDNTNKGRSCPQREQFYILRIGGQDVTYSTIKDSLSQQSNHASHTFHIRVSYNVMFFERKEEHQDDLGSRLDTTTRNSSVDKLQATSTEIGSDAYTFSTVHENQYAS